MIIEYTNTIINQFRRYIDFALNLNWNSISAGVGGIPKYVFFSEARESFISEKRQQFKY